MGDRIIHKRSLTAGSVPTTSSLEVGELAVNVADGKIHLRRSGSAGNDVLSLVTANTITTGSIQATAGFTGSLFGTASWAGNFNETDPIFVARSGSLVTTSSFTQFTSSIQNQVNSLTNATSSYVLNSQTSSMTVLSSSYASNLQGYLPSDFAKLSGGNNFTGTQTITGTLNVIGTASFVYTTASQLDVSTNIISVNTSAAVRFGGLAVIDSGSSPQTSGSLLFDSQNNQWIFVHRGDAGAVTSSVLIMGPQTFNNIGNETTITTNRLTKGTGGDLGEHIGDSNITDTGTLVSINSNTQVTGSLLVTGGITGSLQGTASNANTASYINPLSQSVSVNGMTSTSGSNILNITNGAGSQILNLYGNGDFKQTNANTTMQLFNLSSSAYDQQPGVGFNFIKNNSSVVMGVFDDTAVDKVLSGIYQQDTNTNELAYILTTYDNTLTDSPSANLVFSDGFGNQAAVQASSTGITITGLTSGSDYNTSVFNTAGTRLFGVQNNGLVIISGSLYVSQSILSNGYNVLTVDQTGSMLSPYVLNSSTSSFVQNSVTASMLSPYVLTSVTSSMLEPYVLSSVTSSMLQPYVLSSATSSFVQNSVTASMLLPYVLTSVTSSMTVLSSSFATTASYISPTFISASAAASGFGSGGGSGLTFNEVQRIAFLRI